MRRLSLICITSILTTNYSLENCSVYGRSCRGYKPKSFRFFRKEFRKVKKKKCFLPAKGRFIWWKTVTSVLSTCLLCLGCHNLDSTGGSIMNRRPNSTEDRRPKTHNRNIAHHTLWGVEMHVIGRVLVCRKRWDQSTKRRPSRKCFFKPRNTDMISLAMLCGTLK